tara:strand:- start:180082 stop:181821 length:1740 start_codon:yes stop_codon:yes gene_type:complete
MGDKNRVINGIPASPGISLGRAYIYHRNSKTVNKRLIPSEKIKDEVKRFQRAVELAIEDLTKLQEKIAKNLDQNTLKIFSAHQAVLEDPEVIEVTIVRIRQEKVNAEYIFNDVINGWISNYSTLDNSFFRERTADFEDVLYRVLTKLTGEISFKKFDKTTPVILIARNLSPSDTAEIGRGTVCGLVTDIGGQTSHTAIVARGLGVPAVVGAKVATSEIDEGMLIIIDGNSGTIYLEPDDQTIQKYKSLLAKQVAFKTELQELNNLPAVTIDGRLIELSANIELPVEIDDVLEKGADGIGLYRTEFLYLVRNDLPSEEEQFQVYSEIARRVAPNNVIIRTLDLGADKISSQLLKEEINPALGQRGIRLCLSHPEMFKVQLRAILRASVNGNIRVMFPMISGYSELEQAKDLFQETCDDLKQAGISHDSSVPLGIMVEVPSAAVTANDLAKGVDFFSIGTNDLIQYTIAADRGNSNIASLYNPCHPAVLRLVAGIIDSAHNNSIWVGVCGVMAANPLTACILLGLGVDELSMSPNDIPWIRRLIRSVNYDELRQLSSEAIKLGTSEEIEKYVEPYRIKRQF